MDEARRLPTWLELKPLVAASYMAAAINFGVNHQPWGLIDEDILLAINKSAAVVGTTSFLVWILLVALAFRFHGRRGWWILPGAPFALATFLGVAYYVIASMIFGS